MQNELLSHREILEILPAPDFWLGLCVMHPWNNYNVIELFLLFFLDTI